MVARNHDSEPNQNHNQNHNSSYHNSHHNSHHNSYPTVISCESQCRPAYLRGSSPSQPARFSCGDRVTTADAYNVHMDHEVASDESNDDHDLDAASSGSDVDMSEASEVPNGG